MVALLILAAFFLFLFIVLLFPLRIKVNFDGEFHASLHFLFFKLNLTDASPKQKKQKDKEVPSKSDSAPKKSNLTDKFKRFFKREGISGVIDFISDIASLLGKLTKSLWSHLHINRFHLYLSISDTDAHHTALLYGKACTVISGAYSVLFTLKKCKKKSASVVCDYSKEESSGSFSAQFSILAFFLLGEAFKVLFGAIPLLRRLNQSDAPAPAIKKSTSN